jgi:hypothetical protein
MFIGSNLTVLFNEGPSAAGRTAQEPAGGLPGATDATIALTFGNELPSSAFFGVDSKWACDGGSESEKS